MYINILDVTKSHGQNNTFNWFLYDDENISETYQSEAWSYLIKLLTNGTGTTTLPTTEKALVELVYSRIQFEANSVSNLIDGFLCEKFIVPVISVPDWLKSYARDIYNYYITANKWGLNDESKYAMYEISYKNAIKFLNLIRDDKAFYPSGLILKNTINSDMDKYKILKEDWQIQGW